MGRGKFKSPEGNSFPQAMQGMASAQQALLSGLVSETRLQCKFIHTHKTQPPGLGQISSQPSRNACKGVDIFFQCCIRETHIHLAVGKEWPRHSH